MATTSAGALWLDLTSYSDPDDDVKWTGWTAGTRAAGDAGWQSVAAGMLYNFGKSLKGGKRIEALMEAADEVSGGDLERVEAFLESNAKAAEAAIAEGDIAFVWEWERRPDAAPGLGAELLVSVCDQLRKDSPNLRTLVVSISPQRFAPLGGPEPALVTAARLTDLEGLAGYVQTLESRLNLKVYAVGSSQHDVTPVPEIARV